MITVICVGKLKERWQREGVDEYVKRMSRYGGLEIVEAPDLPEPQKPSAALEKQIIEREGQEILKRLRQTDFVCCLAIGGSALDSEGLSAKLDEWKQLGRRVVFIIGGSLGLSGEVLRRADYKLSFSKFTFPHPLMRVILVEQLYRASKISAGERYHK